MSYRLWIQEALAPGIEGIVKGRIDSALKSLNAKGKHPHEGVHDARIDAYWQVWRWEAPRAQ